MNKVHLLWSAQQNKQTERTYGSGYKFLWVAFHYHGHPPYTASLLKTIQYIHGDWKPSLWDTVAGEMSGKWAEFCVRLMSWENYQHRFESCRRVAEGLAEVEAAGKGVFISALLSAVSTVMSEVADSRNLPVIQVRNCTVHASLHLRLILDDVLTLISNISQGKV